MWVRWVNGIWDPLQKMVKGEMEQTLWDGRK